MSYRQGGYDALYLSQGKLFVIQNTVSLDHEIKWLYVQEAVSALKTIHKCKIKTTQNPIYFTRTLFFLGNVTELEFCFVVPIGNLLEFDLDKCKSDDVTALKLFMSKPTTYHFPKLVYGLQNKIKTQK